MQEQQSKVQGKKSKSVNNGKVLHRSKLQVHKRSRTSNRRRTRKPKDIGRICPTAVANGYPRIDKFPDTYARCHYAIGNGFYIEDLSIKEVIECITWLYPLMNKHPKFVIKKEFQKDTDPGFFLKEMIDVYKAIFSTDENVEYQLLINTEKKKAYICPPLLSDPDLRVFVDFIFTDAKCKFDQIAKNYLIERCVYLRYKYGYSLYTDDGDSGMLKEMFREEGEDYMEIERSEEELKEYRKSIAFLDSSIYNERADTFCGKPNMKIIKDAIAYMKRSKFKKKAELIKRILDAEKYLAAAEKMKVDLNNFIIVGDYDECRLDGGDLLKLDVCGPQYLSEWLSSMDDGYQGMPSAFYPFELNKWSEKKEQNAIDYINLFEKATNELHYLGRELLDLKQYHRKSWT